ncbi:site-2 protease [Pasteurella langaaensis DSM 22999]|uniref:Zinc metalloprotease n=1 Tax=Alitibacter langaaensis DSM 22999 TaxID=1122935 RepID=A0A2U0TGL5_9PAST|nr:sigma E protease regulator RseP [Pasteurella langaaensis]PVX42751.1 site-2 protease [Pasteurella langaaensis DSM 22999]
MSFLWSLISFVIVIGVLVSVHEYGHFWAARKCGVKVHRFSIGFGKVLWKRTDKLGTEFAVSAIPLGGYVKMLDERNEEVPPELKSRSFNSKSVLQRAFIIAAGPLANFLFAIVAYWVIFVVGMPSLKTVVAEVTPNSIAAAAELEPNTQILAVDGVETPDWESINMALAAKLGDEHLTLTVTPFGEHRTQDKILDIRHWSFDPEKESSFRSLGIQPVTSKIKNILSNVVAGSAADRAGLKIGDELLRVNGEEVKWQTLIDKIQQGKPLKLQVKRQNEILDLTLQPEMKDNRYFAGISPTAEPVNEIYRTELKYGILDALWKGVEKTGQLSLLTVKVIGKLFTGDLSLTNLSGPISIAKGAGVSSSIGFVYFLSFMALISVNLGIMNLFPLPVLDGGHLVFLAAEGIKGKPVSERVQDWCYRIGAALLLTLTVFALFNDFLRL